MGDTDWLSVVRDQYGNLKQRYLYANGRPLRVDVMDAAGQPANYFRYNARGDAAGFVDQNGSGATHGRKTKWTANKLRLLDPVSDVSR